MLAASKYAENGSFSETGRELGISKDTVKAILTRHPEDFFAAKKLLAQKMFTTADKAVGIAHDKLQDASASQAAVVAGIFTQRGLEVLGQGTPPVQINVAAFEKSLEMSELIDEIIRRKKLGLNPLPEEFDDPEDDTGQAEAESEA